MPTNQPKRTTGPKKTVKKKTGRGKTVFVIVIIGIAVIISLYFFLGRGPTVSSRGPTEGATKSTGEVAGLDPSAAGQQEPHYVLNRAKLKLEAVDNKNIVQVVIDKALGKSGAEISYKFDWSVNGNPAGDGSDKLSGFKRGDKIEVKITPFDGENALQPSRVLTLDVKNTPPVVNETKDAKFDGKTFSYQVKGVAQDGDTLVYTLEEAPQGMTINSQTGVINWELKDNDYGEHAIKVKIADSKGGVTIHSVKIDLPKPSVEKKP